MRTHGADFYNHAFHAPRSRDHQGPYGRMFSHLPPLELTRQELQSLARHSDKPVLSGDHARRSDPPAPAAYTYLGQFIAHDITFDPTSLHERQLDPEKRINFRTPHLDLDSVYGGGPLLSPHLYDFEAGDFESGYRFRIERLDRGRYRERDLPRTATGIAIVPEPRNDSHLILSQLHLAFMSYHNELMRRLEHGELMDYGELHGRAAFVEARRLTQWAFQWIVLADYLPRILYLGDEEVRRLQLPSGTRAQRLQSRRYQHQDLAPLIRICREQRDRHCGPLGHFRWQSAPYIPIEFAVAAFRFGHAMVRQSYDLNEVHTGLPVFARRSTRSSRPQDANRPEEVFDLRGHRLLPEKATIDWSRFVETGVAEPQRSNMLGLGLATSLSDLPHVEGMEPLAERDLIRSQSLGLPSGQDVARAMGLEADNRREPLWYYLLRNPVEGRIGSLGSRIVADVLIGLIASDPNSFLMQDPHWCPMQEFRSSHYSLTEFLQIARMPLSTAELPWQRRPSGSPL